MGVEITHWHFHSAQLQTLLLFSNYSVGSFSVLVVADGGNADVGGGADVFLGGVCSVSQPTILVSVVVVAVGCYPYSILS